MLSLGALSLNFPDEIVSAWHLMNRDDKLLNENRIKSLLRLCVMMKSFFPRAGNKFQEDLQKKYMK
ncbi:MAG: hypothetical protein A2161_19430 [Candidatus Schekmanbacteria bacterium RBG_13_48_7]|uniref:Uncharacterized protein n=1 Tax=Candidatus Schekmanbacteria bacterium RBG_13_48_7 TaxID=1817878 RepID=A0A1F7RVM5_9BACT|nr:MAG: hypothetical protein A2161_19430 [Candidatus Schekmanbacteria bacterium RBG_13_48_7]